MKMKSSALTVILSAFILAAAIFGGGCSDNQSVRLTSIKIVQGADQCSADPSGKMSQPLRIEARGGKHANVIMEGVRIKVQPAPGSRLTFSPDSGVTDGGGIFSTEVTAGASGDQFFTVCADGYPKLTIKGRVINGVIITGDESEGFTGRKLNDPVSVQLIKNGKPVAGVPVRFEMRASAEGVKSTAKIYTPFAVTDADGVASTEVKLGKKTGSYMLGVDVEGANAGISVRNRLIRLQGVNPWSVAVAVFGGVAFFILGMNMMSDGLRAAAGDNMKKLLQLFTHNRVTGLVAGTVVTAVVQSSAAVTVMVIGFINAGLLSLKQSLGIIFGTNIGTTMTAQIISFDFSAVAVPAVVAGLLMTLSKKRSIKSWGTAVLGFGLLFFGLNMMGSELKLLGEIPSFKQAFLLFDCSPSGGFIPPQALAGAIIIGIVGTALIQSSSAFTGVVLVLGASGLINFYTAFALLLGSNVGTCITALLASMRVNRLAKQAALAHLLFNIFGLVVMVVLLYIRCGADGHPVFLELVNISTPGDAFAPIPQNLERHIAMAHTYFNLSISILLLPFISQFAWICNRLMPVRNEEQKKTRLLEPSLLTTPSVALKQSSTVIRMMVNDAWEMIDRALNEHFIPVNLKSKRIKEIERMEKRVDAMQNEVTDYLVQLMRRPLTAPQSELIPLLMHCNNDAERIADHAENIIELARRLEENGDRLSESALESLKKMWVILDDEARHVVSGLSGNNSKQVAVALKDERKINRMADKFESEHMERLRKGNCSATSGVIYIEMLSELEKIGDRLTNIAERTPQIQTQYVNL